MCQKILALSNRKLNDDKTSQNNTSYINLTAANPENLKFDPHGIASFLRYYNQGFRVQGFAILRFQSKQSALQQTGTMGNNFCYALQTHCQTSLIQRLITVMASDSQGLINSKNLSKSFLSSQNMSVSFGAFTQWRQYATTLINNK